MDHGVSRTLSTDPISVWSPFTESLTLVSQKMCVVVYPQVEEESGTDRASEDREEEQQLPIYQPTPTKDHDSEEQPEP